MPIDFGVFAPVFKSAHGYLALLNFSADDSLDAVRLVQRCAAEDTDRSGTLHLLSDLNWRPTLVAAVAAALSPPDPRVNAALWHRFDTGSWVAPQIGVVLSSIDPGFLPRARARLETHCQVDFSELRSRTMAERHSAAGPAGGAQRSAKAAASLQSIVSGLETPPEWLADILASPGHRVLVARDVDSSDAIVRYWGGSFARIRQELQA